MSKLIQNKIDKVFEPDENGISAWISRETINKEIKETGNNGIMRNGQPSFCGKYNRFIWDKITGSNGRITHLRTKGFNEYQKKEDSIREDILDYHKKTLGVCVVCGSTSDLACDHKNDLYNDPRVLKKETQEKEDFQCLCRHCNILKGKHCMKMKKTGIRYKATDIPSLKMFGIDYISGNESFDENDINAMVGTYWYDPIVFNQYIKDMYDKKDIEITKLQKDLSKKTNIICKLEEQIIKFKNNINNILNYT